MADGRRQVVGYFIPGDFCDLNIYVLRRMDHSIGTITPVRFAEISREEMEAATAGRPRITQAFWWHELVNASVQREWLLSVGQRSPLERIAHLMTELFFRSRSAGLAEGDACPFPLTAYDIADSTGLTPVHVNRTIQEMRRDRLVEVDGKRLLIPDLERLMEAGHFNPNYLHLDREGRHLDAND
jgi:CRP-like cAMP-binding protein